MGISKVASSVVFVAAPVPQSIQFLEPATEEGNVDQEPPPPQQQGQQAAAADLDPPATEVRVCKSFLLLF
jgi:hypothetical protein